MYSHPSILSQLEGFLYQFGFVLSRHVHCSGFHPTVDVQLEYCHNIIIQTKTNKSQKSKEYSPSDAMLMVRLINDLNNEIVREGASFAQQYILTKGLTFWTEGARRLKEETWINYINGVAFLQCHLPQ
jgi:hypothetical protein